MTSVPDPLPPRKPRRWGLYGPFVLLLILIVAWSGWWFWLRIQTSERLAAAAAELKAAGYDVSWTDETIGGYPFRLNVVLTEPRIREPSGWALSAPRLEGQAYLHGLQSWVLATPQGLTFTRPQGGPVQVGGKLLHASLSHFDRSPPNFSFEGVGLTFTPAAGAQPFALTTADKLELHLRAGPDDQAATFLKLDGGKARPDSVLGRIAGGRPVSANWEATLSRISTLDGADWRQAVQAWTGAGGQASVTQAGITAGPATLGVRSGRLTVGGDGRLRGQLDVTLRGAMEALAVMASGGAIRPESALAAAAVTAARQGNGSTASATLTFEAGQTTLGPVAISPAPRVY